MTVQTKIYTTADLKDWPDDYELIEGEMVEKQPTTALHAWIRGYIQRQVSDFDEDDQLGLMLIRAGLQFDSYNAPQPDLAFWIKERMPDLDLEITKVIPDLAVEVWSPHDLDGPQNRAEAMSKIRRYQAAGIKLIWVINPVAKEALVYVPGQLEAVETLGINDELDGKDIIPGFKLKLKDLFPASKSK